MERKGRKGFEQKSSYKYQSEFETKRSKNKRDHILMLSISMMTQVGFIFLSGMPSGHLQPFSFRSWLPFFMGALGRRLKWHKDFSCPFSVLLYSFPSLSPCLHVYVINR
jgi:hypothetical protein